MNDIIPDNPFCRREVSHRHPNNPAVYIRDLGAFPLCGVFVHGNILGFPVVGLHGAIEVVSPGILQRQKVEGHGDPTINHALFCNGLLGLIYIQDESTPAKRVGSGCHTPKLTQ